MVPLLADIFEFQKGESLTYYLMHLIVLPVMNTNSYFRIYRINVKSNKSLVPHLGVFPLDFGIRTKTILQQCNNMILKSI